MNDILQVQGINSKGFGIIPKLVMQDKQLTVQAKAIYGYFCSYAGAGRTAFPSRDKIIFDLGMSINSYYKHFNLLKEYGYITVLQDKNKDGQFQRNIYTLIEILPCTQKSNTVNNLESPCISLPYTAEPYTVKPRTVKCDTNNNNNKNDKNKINSVINNSPSSQSAKNDFKIQKYNDKTDDTAEKINFYTELIKDNITYSDFEECRPNDTRLINEIIDIIIDALVSDFKYVRIDGENKPRELVKHILLSLDYGNIEHVIEQFKSFTGRINKKRQFILTMLYNSKMELDSHYINLVNHDMHN